MNIRDSLPVQKVILEVENDSKEFPGMKALNNVSLRVVEVEIHCPVSENGFLF
jgi:putative multiple sugar transport system ATP-binding protein